MNNNENLRIISAQCPNCGASIVASSLSPTIKCHWCNTILSTDLFNENVKIPDMILPFSITKEEAKEKMNEYIKEREKYASNDFISALNLESISPVYLPYMVVDTKIHISASGIGEKSISPPVKGQNGRYNAAIYEINYDFDLDIDNLIIESSDSGVFDNYNSTSNVISSVSPFDIENSVKFNPNFLNGYNSENRELNINELNNQIPNISQEISQTVLDKYFDIYDRECSWNDPKIDILSSSWKSSYLPVWLYSFKDDKANKTFYIATNGRTGKTIGSIPVSMKKAGFNMGLIMMITGFIILAVLICLALFFLIVIKDPMIKTFFLSELVGIGFLDLVVFLFAWLAYRSKRYEKIEKLENDDVKIDYVNDVKYKIINDNFKEKLSRELWVTDHKKSRDKNGHLTIYR